MFEHIIESDHLYLVAGPCSAESYDQLRDTCEALMQSDTCDLLRVGVWKPRTRPGGFEGRGEEALRWMRSLKEMHPSWRFAIEVATPAHVEKALEYGIDALWIGARTTGNPFLVGELAAALSGTAMPVMVKNPLSPEVDLWLGAIERFQKAGLTDLAAVHRGFSTPMPARQELRNDPVWQAPFELRQRMPSLPLLCDPSHLAGSRENIPEVSRTALRLDFDGLMIESHICPSEALTDATQQLEPKNLFLMLQSLHRTSGASSSVPPELTILRERLSLIDAELLQLLSQRLDISREIAAVKQAHNLSTYQPAQRTRKLAALQQQSLSLGLDPAFVKDLYDRLHLESIRAQLGTVKSE